MSLISKLAGVAPLKVIRPRRLPPCLRQGGLLTGLGLAIVILATTHAYRVYAEEQKSPASPNSQSFQTETPDDFPIDKNDFLGAKVNIIPNMQGNSLIAYRQPFPQISQKKIVSKMILVTAYSSTPWETDSTPFTTASGTTVRDGIVAANFLPIGAKIKLPELYGEKELVVEDRMNPRYWNHIDIWMPSSAEARNFGAKWTKITIES